jgi:hypothetical protein
MSSRRSVRQVLVAVLLGVLVGGGLMAVTPAGAEVSSAVATNWKKIWKKNLKPLADRRYYTKKQSDAKYATPAQSDAKYATKADAAAATAAANAATDTKLGNYYTKSQGDARYLPKRSLLTGVWASGAVPSGSQPVVAINFGAVLAAAPTTAVYRAPGSAPTAQCPGTFEAPDAAAGVLCVYAYENQNFNGHYFFNLRQEGATMAAFSTSNASYMDGTWAVRPTGFAVASLRPTSPKAPALTGSSAGR